MSETYRKTLEKEAELAEQAKGVKLEDIAIGEKLKIVTKNTEYILEHREEGYYLSGHKKYCPTPKKVIINGSTWGGSAIITGFLGIGMHMEINSIEGTDIAGNAITTSEIENIERI